MSRKLGLITPGSPLDELLLIRQKAFKMTREEAEEHLETDILGTILYNEPAAWERDLAFLWKCWSYLSPAMASRICFTAIARASRLGSPLPVFILPLAEGAFGIKPRRNGLENPLAWFSAVNAMAINPNMGARELGKTVGVAHKTINEWKKSPRFKEAVRLKGEENRKIAELGLS